MGNVQAVHELIARYPNRVLTHQAFQDYLQFVKEYGLSGNCSCHIRPPCGSCTHPGNPRNLEGDEDAWEPYVWTNI